MRQIARASGFVTNTRKPWKTEIGRLHNRPGAAGRPTPSSHPEWQPISSPAQFIAESAAPRINPGIVNPISTIPRHAVGPAQRNMPKLLPQPRIERFTPQKRSRCRKAGFFAATAGCLTAPAPAADCPLPFNHTEFALLSSDGSLRRHSDVRRFFTN